MLEVGCGAHKVWPAFGLPAAAAAPAHQEQTGHASDLVSEAMQQRVVAYWNRVDAQLGAGVAAGLGLGAAVLAPAQELVAARANRA